MILHILEANVCGPHCLDLLFDNGVRKRVNVRPLLQGRIFEPLKDPAYFARVTVEPVGGTVVWPNGADFAPEALYALKGEGGEPAKQDRILPHVDGVPILWPESDPMRRLLIRTATATDAHDVARIYVDSWNMGFCGLMPALELAAEHIARWERALVVPVPHRWWVADVNGAVVGFAGIRPSRDPLDPELGELDTIAIDPDWWRRGVGRALMAVTIHYLGTDGYRAAILWTLARYERGQRFYEAMGWQLDGGVRDEGRQVRYRYELSASFIRSRCSTT